MKGKDKNYDEKEKYINRKVIKKDQQIKKLKLNIVTRYPMIRY